jgi:hypothetical protein
MTQNNTCATCNWWCRVNPTKRFGLCVWHTGSKGHDPEIKFKGSLKTRPDFGCVCWALSDRESVQSQSEGI